MDPLEQLDYFHEKLRPYIKALLNHEFGLLCKKIEIDNIKSGTLVEKNGEDNGDRFQLRILYCKKPMYWQVIMNPENLREPPDFIMEDDFLSGADTALIKTRVPSLSNWDPSNARCLLNVILELLEIYKEEQVNHLKDPKLNRCFIEYETLIALNNLTRSDVEVFVQNNGRIIAVTFLISIYLDLSNLPTAMQTEKIPAIFCVELRDNTKYVIKLIPRGELEDAIGDLDDLPELSSELPHETSLLELVTHVRELLQNKIDETADRFKMRRLLYGFLLSLLEPAVLNGDTITYQRASFLLEWNKFYCVLEIKIPLSFPAQRPCLTLLTFSKQSKNTVPFKVEANSYPYSPRWDCERIAKEIFTFIRDKAIPDFEALCTDDEFVK